MRITLLLSCIFILSRSAQAINWPYEISPITISDFGPRNLKGGKCGNNTDFHYGLDFSPSGLSSGAAFGYPIRAVAAGTINQIDQGPDRLVRIKINNDLGGQSHFLDYLHIFHNGTLPLRSGLFELRRSTEAGQRLYIVRKASGTIPAAAFAVGDSFNVPGFPGLRTQNQVSEGDLIAPTGNSGKNMPVHLHLGLDMDFANSGKGQCGKTAGKNPFLFLPHDPIRLPIAEHGGAIESRSGGAAPYVINTLSPVCGQVLTRADIRNLTLPDSSRKTVFVSPIKALVDSRNGLDLNQVDITLKAPAGLGDFHLGS